MQALALRAPEQLVLFPDFVATTGELAIELDHWATLVLERYASDLTEPQVSGLRALHRKLATMSRDGAEFDADLWSESALGSSVHWQEVRDLAIAVRDTFGWSAGSGPDTAEPEAHGAATEPVGVDDME